MYAERRKTRPIKKRNNTVTMYAFDGSFQHLASILLSFGEWKKAFTLIDQDKNSYLTDLKFLQCNLKYVLASPWTPVEIGKTYFFLAPTKTKKNSNNETELIGPPKIVQMTIAQHDLDVFDACRKMADKQIALDKASRRRCQDENYQNYRHLCDDFKFFNIDNTMSDVDRARALDKWFEHEESEKTNWLAEKSKNMTTKQRQEHVQYLLRQEILENEFCTPLFGACSATTESNKICHQPTLLSIGDEFLCLQHFQDFLSFDYWRIDKNGLFHKCICTCDECATAMGPIDPNKPIEFFDD